MRTPFSHVIFIASKHNIFITGLVFVFMFQVSIFSLWAEEKTGSELSLSETVELALDFNSKKRTGTSFLSPEDVTFLVKKYYYQIQTQVEQLDLAEEVRDHFQKAVDKSGENLEEGEGDVSQSDLTKMKLGLSDTLNDIIGLKHKMQIAKLQLGELIGKELKPSSDIVTTDIVPVPFLYSSFDEYLKAKSASQLSENSEGKVGMATSKTIGKISIKLSEGDRLTLHKAFIIVKEAEAKVTLGKKNRKITRALLVSEVANYDFGIGDPQELFQAFIIYAHVLNGYLGSIFTLNIAVAELEKLTDAVYK